MKISKRLRAENALAGIGTIICSSVVMVLGHKERASIKVIHLEGTPYEMGYQHGEQCEELIEKEISFVKGGCLPKIQKLMEQMGRHVNMAELWKKRSQYLENNLKEKAPELLEELKGIAEGSEKKL
jgi:uncharacterized C2H2 Zn-finger protein